MGERLPGQQRGPGGGAARPVGGRHQLPARRLDAGEPDGPAGRAQPGGLRGHQDLPGNRGVEGGGPAVVAGADRGDAVELETGRGGAVVRGQPAPGAGLGGDAVDPGGHLGGRAGGVHQAVCGRELRRVGGFAALGRRRRGAGRQAVEHVDHERTAALGEVGEHGPGGLVGRDGAGEPGEDGAGVQALFELEHVGGDLGLPGHHGALDGGGAAVGRQRGEVQVEPAVAGGLQGLGGHERPVGDDDGHVCLERPDRLEGIGALGSAESVGLEHGQAGLLGHDRDRRRGQHPPAPDRGVRPGEHADDLVGRVEQGAQHGHGGLGRAGVEHAQGRRGGHRAAPVPAAGAAGAPKTELTAAARSAPMRRAARSTSPARMRRRASRRSSPSRRST